MYQIEVDGHTIHDPRVDAYNLSYAKLDLELNKTGSLEFDITERNPGYKYISPMKSIISVYDDGDLIFRGRSVTDDSDFYNTGTLKCEGELAFLMDSVLRPQATGFVNQTNRYVFQEILSEHNSNVPVEKQFKAGIIDVDEDTISQLSFNYEHPLDFINTNLIEPYGGYLRIRYEEGVRYLDWVKQYGKVATQPIRFGYNLLDLKKSLVSTDVCTRCIPLGGSDRKVTIKNATGQNGVDYIEDAEAIEYYGEITKTVEFPEVNDPDTLLQKGIEWFEENMKSSLTVELTAVDLHMIDVSIGDFKIGDLVEVISLPHNIAFKDDERPVIEKYSYDLINPENNTITIGKTLKAFTENGDSATKADLEEVKGKIDGYIVTNDGKIEEITTDIEKFKALVLEELEVTNAEIENLKANNVTVEYLEANYAKIEDLETTNAKIENLSGEFLSFKNGEFENLNADYANFKKTTTEELTAAKGWMAEGSIGSAQISDLDANKIRSGTLDTSLVTVASKDSVMAITGNQLMVNDTTDALNPYNRVILGKYNKDENTIEYGLLIRSKDGQTIMLDGDGVHNEGITDGAVDNNKVADDANIEGKKLDINSVIREVNGATETIKSTVIQVGDRTLEVVLEEQNNTITEHGEELVTQKAQIEANQTAISLKVDNQTYTQDKESLAEQLSKATSDISILQNQISLKVEQTDIDTSLEGALKDYSTTSQLQAAINVAKNEISSSVSSTYATREEVEVVDGKFADYSTTAQMNSAIDQKVSENQSTILAEVSATYTTKEDFSNLSVSSRNLLLETTNPVSKTLTGETNGSIGKQYNLSVDSSEIQGKQCYIGFDWVYEGDSPSGKFMPHTGSPQYSRIKEIEITEDNISGSVSIPWTPSTTSSFNGIYFRTDNITGKLTISKFRLFLGDKDTGWTPAPEDAESTMNSIKASLELKVDRDKMISEINASADVITLTGNRFVVDADNFSLTAEGRMTSTAGKIAGWDIDEDGLSVAYSGNFPFAGGTLGTEGIAHVKLYSEPDSLELSAPIMSPSGVQLKGGGVYAVKILDYHLDDENSYHEGTTTFGIGKDGNTIIHNSSSNYISIGDTVDVYGDMNIYGKIKTKYSIAPMTENSGKFACGLDDARWSTVYSNNVNADGKIYFPGITSSTSVTRTLYMGATAGQLYYKASSSSETIKHDVFPLRNKDIAAERLYDLEVVQFKYNEDILSSDDQRYMTDMPGFIIEQMNEVYPIAVDKETENVKDWAWNAQYLIPGMVKLLQNDRKDIDSTSARIDSLSYMLEQAFNEIASLKKENETLKQALA